MELTAKDFTAQLAAKGYTPGIDFDVDNGDEPGNEEQEEKFFDAWRAALEGIGIDLNDIKVSSR